MENISVYNTLFPYSAYKVVGVTRRTDGRFCVVMEQPRIVGKQVDLDTYLHEGYFEKTKDYFESMGMKMLDDNISFTNGKYYVSDIHYGNVIFSKDGKPYIIDADAKYHGRYRRNNMDNKPLVVDNEKGDFQMETGKTFSDTKENFDGVRDRAVKEKGIVMPNLRKESVKVVNIEKSPLVTILKHLWLMQENGQRRILRLRMNPNCQLCVMARLIQ